MPKIDLRPTPSECNNITRTLVESSDLTKIARKQLRIVLAWAEGQTLREIARDPAFACSPETARKATMLYKQGGLAAFYRSRTRPQGRPALSANVAEAVAEALRVSFEKGEPVNYREVREKLGVSLGAISAIAKRFKLDAENRRGPVAPRTGAGQARPGGAQVS